VVAHELAERARLLFAQLGRSPCVVRRSAAEALASE
jgi:hypothetical protein